MARAIVLKAASWTGQGVWLSRSSEAEFGPAWSSEPWAAVSSTRFTREETGRGGRIGAYRLLERLGRGRQADVWRAQGGQTGTREVALKVLSASARDPRRRAQLKHEAMRGTRFAGPSLLPTYEFGEADGAVFMAMPLVVGCTLADIVAQRRARLAGEPTGALHHQLAGASEASYTREIVNLLAQVARAAADAHDARVVHRDIKPGNILVRRDHAEGVYLCDFGLARDLDVATPTQLRDGAGSPLYMAPERLLRHTADEVRGDVYALGVTLYEALMLVPPVEVPADMPCSRWASFLAAASPRLPSNLWPAIPPALESVVLRALSREPERRHPTPDHLASDLESFVAGVSVSCEERSGRYVRLGARSEY